MSTFWKVQYGNAVVICNSIRGDRMDARKIAGKWLGGDPDEYKVKRLTTQNDRVKVDLICQV